MARGFRIAEAYVDIKADATGLRSEVTRDVEAASVGQDIKVGVRVAEGSSSLLSKIAPFILPAVAAVGQLTGALGLVPAAAGAAGISVATLKIGMSGFGDAIKNANAAKNTQELNDALKDLAPNARESALAVHNLAPAWNNLHLDVQQRLFQGVGKDIQRLGVADLPVLRAGLNQTAGALNQGVHYFTAWASSSKTVADLKTIFDNTGVATQNLMRSLQPILSIIRDLATVGSQFLPQLTNGFALAAQRAADFVGHARETGQLHQWIQTGIDAVHKLWTVFTDLIQIIMKISQAPPLFGLDFLSALTSVTGFVLKLVTTFPELLPLLEAVIIAWKAYTLVQWAVNAAMSANPIGLVILAVVALIAIGIEVVKHWTEIKTFFVGLWATLEGLFDSGMAKIRGLLDWFNGLGPRFQAWFRGAVNAAGSEIGHLVGLAVDLPGRILGALGNLGGLLYNSGRSLITGLINGFMSMVDYVKSKISGALSSIRNLFPFSPAKEGPFSGTGYTTFSGAALIQDWAGGMQSKLSVATGTASRIAGAVAGGLNGLPRGVVSLAGRAATAVTSNVGTAAGGVTVGNLHLHIAGNLDPTNPMAWRQAMEKIQEGIRGVERSWA